MSITGSQSLSSRCVGKILANPNFFIKACLMSHNFFFQRTGKQTHRQQQRSFYFSKYMEGKKTSLLIRLSAQLLRHNIRIPLLKGYSFLILREIRGFSLELLSSSEQAYVQKLTGQFYPCRWYSPHRWNSSYKTLMFLYFQEKYRDLARSCREKI